MFPVKIINRNSGKVLDVDNASLSDGANVQQWGDWGGDNQLWWIEDRGSDKKSIRGVKSGKALDVTAGSKDNFANIQQWGYWGGDNQLWKIEQVEEGWFTIKSCSSGKVLDVSGHSMDDGGNVQQYTYGDGTNQQWRFEQVIRPAVLNQATVKWKNGANYDQMEMDSSTLIGVQSDGNIFVVNPDSGVSTLSAVGGVIVTKTPLGPGYKLVDSVAFMRVSNGESVNGLDTVDVAIFEGHAEAELQPLYAGAGVGFNLAGGSASIFDFNLGVGLSTGVGLKDESVELKVAGTGVTVGRKISISVLDNSFGIDLVRTAHAVWYTGKELGVAVAIVPGAMEDTGSSLLEEFKSMPGTFADAGVGIWSSVKQIPGAFAPIPGAFADAGKELGGMVADGATGAAKGIAGAATSVASGTADVASGAYHAAKDGVEEVGKVAGKVASKLNPFNW